MQHIQNPDTYPDLLSYGDQMVEPFDFQTLHLNTGPVIEIKLSKGHLAFIVVRFNSLTLLEGHHSSTQLQSNLTTPILYLM
jgi:hypothetical protein